MCGGTDENVQGTDKMTRQSAHCPRRNNRPCVVKQQPESGHFVGIDGVRIIADVTDGSGLGVGVLVHMAPGD